LQQFALVTDGRIGKKRKQTAENLLMKVEHLTVDLVKSICLFGLKELPLVTSVTKISVFNKTPLFIAL
jgi:VanZ family protein